MVCVPDYLFHANRGCGGDQNILGIKVTGTAGAEAVNVIPLSLQLTDPWGDPITQPMHIKGWLSDAATGIGVSAAAPDGGVSDGGAGAIIAEPVANLVFDLVTDADGLIELDVQESTAKTFYFVAVQPNGTLKITELAFAA